MAKLSVNINKFATLRNARGGNNPNILKVATDCERFGADGITVHPRPDERHIRFDDVRRLKAIVKTELNVEGRPDRSFMDLIRAVRPDQCTLVPDAPSAVTSNAGWDTLRNASFLSEIVSELRYLKVRSSIFVDPDPLMIEGAAECGCDRVELYTEGYAKQFPTDQRRAVQGYRMAANAAGEQGLGVNAGHDLNLNNLGYFFQHVNGLLEVSIGHGLICDALYLGLENTVAMYKRLLRNDSRLQSSAE